MAASIATGLMTAAPAASQPASCDGPSCVPGIKSGVVLGASCSDTAYYVFGTTSWGRLVFCGTPRRYEPRWFRSPDMRGIKDYMSDCAGYDGEVAQAPDGRFLACHAREDGFPRWESGEQLRPAP